MDVTLLVVALLVTGVLTWWFMTPPGEDAAPGPGTPTRTRWAVAVAAAGLIVAVAVAAFLLARYR